MSSVQLKSPLFVALDIDDEASALNLAQLTKDYVGGFKVGPRLTYKYGSSFIKKLAQIGPVFVDNKYHDIPSTVMAAIKATFESGASFATIHASNGPEALKEMAMLEQNLNRERPFQILCVTVLTSFHDTNLPSHWQRSQAHAKFTTKDHVLALAHDVVTAGLTGLVCSAEEVALLRDKYADAYLVTPGIRLPTDAKGDQSRVMGPREAIAAGSSALVVGRPIVEAKDPRQAAQKFFDLLAE